MLSDIDGDKPRSSDYVQNPRPEITRFVELRRIAKGILIRVKYMSSQNAVTSTSNQNDCEKDGLANPHNQIHDSSPHQGLNDWSCTDFYEKNEQGR